MDYFPPAAYDELAIRSAQECIEKAKKALALPRPSIFLGERRYAPFGSENGE
jgi:hypothetical protein